jgi:cytochrome c oxidase subunit I
VLSFLFLFTIGGLTGLFLGTLATDIHLHDTYFVVAHFHYVMMGGTLIAFLGGLHYWWPKMFGRMYSEKWGRTAAVMIFVGFNVTFFTQFIMGSKGMPRRYYNYPPEFQIYHQISTYGSYLLAAGFVLIAVYLITSLFKGRPAPANPWGAGTMEWQCASPPPYYNFHEPPAEHDPYDFSHLRYDVDIDGYLPAPGAQGS